MRLGLGIKGSSIGKMNPMSMILPKCQFRQFAFWRKFRNVIHFKFPRNCLGNLMKVRFPGSRL